MRYTIDIIRTEVNKYAVIIDNETSEIVINFGIRHSLVIDDGQVLLEANQLLRAISEQFN